MSWNIDKYILPTVYIFSEWRGERTLGELLCYFTEEWVVWNVVSSVCFVCREDSNSLKSNVFFPSSGDMIFVKITNEWICFARSFPLCQWWPSLPQLTPGYRRTSSLSWRFSDRKCKLSKGMNLKPRGSGSHTAVHCNLLRSLTHPDAHVVRGAS